MRVEQRWTYW